MADPVLHVLAGPNGAGKSTFVEHVLGPATGLPFVNADLIAAERWPGAELEHGHAAAALAAKAREQLIEKRVSFITETVFSHPSKVELLVRARAAGYRTTLHVILVSEDGAVARVKNRVLHNGHDVPEDKVRARYQRMWDHVATAITIVDEAYIYDNSLSASPYRRVARFLMGSRFDKADWPVWTPAPLREAGIDFI